MMKTTILALTALATIALAVPSTTSAAQAAGACNFPFCVPIPPPPGNPGTPGQPGGPDNSKPVDEGPEFADNELKMLIACRVPTKTELSTELRFRNIGDATIPQGTKIVWYISDNQQGGEFFLPRDLQVGSELTEADLLKLGVSGKIHCMSKLA
jgi:hypothetical protein